MMGLVEASKKPILGWRDYESRSSRSEYWWGLLAMLVLMGSAQFAYAFMLAKIVGPSAFQGGVLTADNQQAVWLMPVSVFGFCIFMLPLTARRFKDHGMKAPWFKIAGYINLLLGVCVVLGLAVLLFGKRQLALTLLIPAIPLMILPYASVLWCFWIGFVRPESGSNDYGPNPNEVPQ